MRSLARMVAGTVFWWKGSSRSYISRWPLHWDLQCFQKRTKNCFLLILKGNNCPTRVPSQPCKASSHEASDPITSGDNSGQCTRTGSTFDKNKEHARFSGIWRFRSSYFLGVHLLQQKHHYFYAINLTQTRGIKQTPPEKVLGNCKVSTWL